jgi:hypothetical protein
MLYRYLSKNDFYNGADERILVEKNVGHGGRRRRREEISYYEITAKGIWKVFCDLGIFLLPPCVFD